MSFQFSEEQAAFAESVRKYLADVVTSELLHRARDNPSFQESLLAGVRELGLFTIFSMKDESFTPGGVELGIVGVESGRALAPLPLGDLVLAGPYLLSRIGRDSVTIPAGVGEEIESGHRYCLVPTVLPDGEVLPSTMPTVDVVRIEGQQVRWYPSDAVHRGRVVQSIDLLSPGTYVTFDPAEGRELPISGKELRSIMLVLKANECAGIAARSVAMTKEYVETRKQFGVEIGTFQAVQHRIADMHTLSEAIGSLARFAAWSIDNAPSQASFAALTAMEFAAAHTSEIVEGAIQLHGGIGFTWEYDLHLFLRRAKFLEITYGVWQEERMQIIEGARA